MDKPSQDEPGTMPLAVAQARASAGSLPAAMSAEPAQDLDGAKVDEGNGHHRLPELVGRLWLRRPPIRRPRISGPWRRRLILAAWPVGLGAAGVALYLCYLAVSRTEAVTSDGASNALQAWDMLHGNPLLRGWLLGHVSFYTTELPEYMLVEAVRGLNADVLHVSAAITYTLVVLLGGLLGRGRAKGREGLVRFAIAAGIMVAPQLGPGVFILVFQPDHVGTQVPLLATWLVLDRAPRSWYVPVVVAVMLAWAEVADSFAVLIAAVPLGAVAAMRAYRTLVQRRDPLRSGRFDLSLIAASCLSVVAASVAVKLIGDHGGYSVLATPTSLATTSMMSSHVWLTVEGVLGIYGADIFGMTFGLATCIALLHLVGLALAAWGLWLVIRQFFGCDDRIAQVLALSILITLAAYLFSSIPITYYSARYLAGVLTGGAVLAGRMLGRRFMEARLVPALAVVLAFYLAAVLHTAVQPSVPAVSQDLADWLAANHLTYGLSSYGIANTTTLASSETVDVRPVSWEGNYVAGGPYEFEKSWYDPTLHYANFVVLINPPVPIDPIALREVRVSFGKPQHIYHFSRYTIMVFNKNLLTDLAPTR
jgi:hypothetical protein